MGTRIHFSQSRAVGVVHAVPHERGSHRDAKQVVNARGTGGGAETGHDATERE